MMQIEYQESKSLRKDFNDYLYSESIFRFQKEIFLANSNILSKKMLLKHLGSHFRYMMKSSIVKNLTLKSVSNLKSRKLKIKKLKNLMILVTLLI